MKRYAIVIEDAGTNLAAYVPDLPGCVATGDTVASIEREIRGNPVSHPGITRGWLPMPEPSSIAEYVET